MYCGRVHDKEFIENNSDVTIDPDLRIQFDRYVVDLESVYIVQFENDKTKN